MKMEQLNLPGCYSEYRLAVRFRRAVLGCYESRGPFTQAQVYAMLAAFQANQEEGVLELLQENGKAAGGLFNWLGTKEYKREGGRPPRSDQFVLLLDAVVLMCCPNAYTHLLRDALRLRSHEFMVQGSHASIHGERWAKFWKAVGTIETSGKRMWREWFGRDPGPLPERWWERVARQQGLMG